MSEVKLVIDGEEVILEQTGKTKDGTYEKYREPEKYGKMGVGKQPLIVTVHLKPGWEPSSK